MAESTLSLSKVDYEVKVSRIAGYPIGIANGGDKDPTAKQSSIIKDCVESGLRRFYHCGYKWSFLRPFVTIALADGERTVRLPDDYAGVEGRITISDGSSSLFEEIEFINPAKVDAMYSAYPDSTGRPQYASQRALKGTSKTKGQPNEVFVFPEADSDYWLRFQTYILPNCLDGTYPYAYGGAEHVETILESCMAILEERYDNIPAGYGPHGIAYEKLLKESMALDRRKKPQSIGRNTDTSDDNVCWFDSRSAVTYNGVDYSTE